MNFAVQNEPEFCPFLVFKSGLWPKIFGFLQILDFLKVQKSVKSPKKVGKSPLSDFKSGQKMAKNRVHFGRKRPFLAFFGSILDILAKSPLFFIISA